MIAEAVDEMLARHTMPIAKRSLFELTMPASQILDVSPKMQRSPRQVAADFAADEITLFIGRNALDDGYRHKNITDAAQRHA